MPTSCRGYRGGSNAHLTSFVLYEFACLHNPEFLICATAELWYVLLEQAGLPRIRFHDLRHTAATFMLTQGVHPKVASEMLGHSQIAITLDLYSHVTPTMQREAADSLQAATTLRRSPTMTGRFSAPRYEA